MGRRRKRKPHERDVHGILLLDKPAGITSNDALQKIKRFYRAARAGHTGSLDKPATGMLPVCLGEATKVSAYLLNAAKTYVAIGKLGVVTNTADVTGEVLKISPIPLLNQQDIEEVLTKFIGGIEQIPPMYSALKVNGQKLYQLAYKGIEIERQPRSVTIHQIDLLNLDHDSFKLQVHCSKGTYIRTLIEDIGKALGCGAHVSTLRRLFTEPFYEDQMVTMEDIEKGREQSEEQGNILLDRLLMPVDSALKDLPAVELTEEEIFYLCRGQTVPMSKEHAAGLVRIYDYNGAFTGIGIIRDDGRVAPKRLMKRDS